LGAKLRQKIETGKAWPLYKRPAHLIFVPGSEICMGYLMWGSLAGIAALVVAPQGRPFIIRMLQFTDEQ
jgi:hypothetical protein